MKRLLPICVTLTVLLGLVCSVTAHPTVKIQGGPYQAGSGGEFTVTVLSGDIPGNPIGSQFQSFCIETNEYVSFGQTYYAVLNDKAIQGGSGGPQPDPLDPGTAWLYNEFLNRTLIGYDFDSDIGRKTSAGALQNAIWYIEQEKSAPMPGSLADDFVQLANASDWNTNSYIGNIRVLNLYKDPCLNTKAQDQLVRIIPAPGALILTMIGTTFVGWLRKLRTF